jgi:hypothetical protein
MERKKIADYAGVCLIGIGVLLIAFQLWIERNDPYLIGRMTKEFNIDFYSVSGHTNVVGFGVLLVGAFLLIVSSFGRTRAKKK